MAVLLGTAVGFAQIADPVPGPIPVGNIAVEVELTTLLPDSGSVSRPRARPMMLSGDGTGRIFVADQNGEVLQIHAGGLTSVFLDVGAATSLVANQGQKGLNGFAFHPDFHWVGAPGYGSTSKIIAEAAICLVKDCADTGGGVWTPAVALGERLTPRLVERAGMTFDVEDA